VVLIIVGRHRLQAIQVEVEVVEQIMELQVEQPLLQVREMREDKVDRGTIILAMEAEAEAPAPQVKLEVVVVQEAPA
jgi:hypothetical protein